MADADVLPYDYKQYGKSVEGYLDTAQHDAAAAKLQCVDWWSPYSDAGRAGDDPTLATPNSNPPDDMDAVPTNAVNNTSNAHIVGDEDLGCVHLLHSRVSARL